MRYSLLLLFSFLFSANFSLQAQTSGTTKTTKPERESDFVDTSTINDSVKNGASTMEVFYGYRSYFNNFQDRFNTTKKFKPGTPVQLAGLGFSGILAVNRKANVYGHFLYNQVVPQTVHVNDSITCKLTGFVFSVAYGGAVSNKAKNFFMLFYAGFNTGRLRFYGNETVRQKNPFFAPKIGIQPKLLIGKFTITLVAEADYDVSKPGWRRMMRANKDKVSITDFRQSGLTTLIGVSYRIFKYETDRYRDGGD